MHENALKIELERFGLHVDKQRQIDVFYKSVKVGEYYADLLVEGEVIIELKAAEKLIEKHEQQLLNYLKATDKEVELLLNFGKTPQIKRKVFSAKYK